MTLDELELIVRERRGASAVESYTASLLGDPERTQRKIMEEAFELCLELGRTDVEPDRVAAEAADLVYHLLVGLVTVDVAFDDVLAVLEMRRR